MIVHDFARLFAGRNDARGTGRGEVRRGPLLLRHYERHLRGEGPGLGVFPLLDDSTVRFAAIDLDEPAFALAAEMRDLVPGAAWLERSRSGNAHVWAFFSAPLEAWVARGVLRSVVRLVDRPRAEVFPKQHRLLPGMVGNYINLPYHGGSRMVMQRGYPLSLPTFVVAANAGRTNPDEWRARAARLGVEPPEARERTASFGDAAVLHICAGHILATHRDNPIREGHRAVVYFNLAKQLLNWRDLDEDEAWELLREVNADADPPTDERELRRVFDNARRGEWTSTGCDDPLFAPYAHPDCPIAKGA